MSTETDAELDISVETALTPTKSSVSGGSAKEHEAAPNSSEKCYTEVGMEKIESEVSQEMGVVENVIISDPRDVATTIISTDDDPTLCPWTARMWILGVSLSAFGASLETLLFFKPAGLYTTSIFWTVTSFILGELMSGLIPRRGALGRLLNRQDFNIKEHAMIVIMASSGSSIALAMEALATQKLYYPTQPGSAASIFLIISTQLLGYGLAGILRNSLVYPTKMLWPAQLPVATLMQTLHSEKAGYRKRISYFWKLFTGLAIWEIFPQWICPWLNNISIFCLADQHSSVFTNIFGGSNYNEGMGLLGICLDLSAIGSTPLWSPLQATLSLLVGTIIAYPLFLGIYYTDTYNAKGFPFISQSLFTSQSTAGAPVVYNQTAILGSNSIVNATLLQEQGLPSLSASNLVRSIVTNLSVTAMVVHLLLFNYGDLQVTARFLNPIRVYHQLRANPQFWKNTVPHSETQFEVESRIIDAHREKMLIYRECPTWWYIVTLIGSIATVISVLYAIKSGLTWWAYIVSLMLSFTIALFLGSLQGLTGQSITINSFTTLIGAYMLPGNPLALIYFQIVTSTAAQQCISLVADMKLAQYVKLPPRATFTAQVVATAIGAILNYVVMEDVTTNQRSILLSLEGTNVWSGGAIQGYNADMITWSIAKDMYSIGAKYQIVTISFLIGLMIPVPFWVLHKKWPKAGFDYIYTPLILSNIYWMGGNYALMFFVLAFTSQFYLRRHYPAIFGKYNYLTAAAIDGGTTFTVFILTFAVFGAAGTAHYFPVWWGNNQNGNFDHCAYAY